MKIYHLGHSCFKVKLKGYTFLLDPWLDELAFFKSWYPLFKMDPAELGHIDYMWFSHEHPDHFNPEYVKKILFKNKNIQVLFQNTFDKKIYNFFKSLNTNIIELRNQKYLKIDNNIKIQINSCGLYDSYFQIKDEDFCFTHLNDCVFSFSSQLRPALEFSNGNQHILTSQFGLAHLPCDHRKKLQLKKFMDDKISKLIDQIKYLRPDYFIPSSSSVHFCHEENQHMNDTRINPYDLKDRIKFTKFILGDQNTELNFKNKKKRGGVNCKCDNLSRKKYDELLKNTKNKILIKSKPVSYDEIIINIKKKSDKLKKLNNKFILFFLKIFTFILKDCNFYIKDTKQFIRVNVLNNKIKEIKLCKNYVELSSCTINNLYKSDFSIDSLIASGCFTLNNYSINELNDHLNIDNLNQAGIYLKFSTLFNIGIYRKLFGILFQYLRFKFLHKNDI